MDPPVAPKYPIGTPNVKWGEVELAAWSNLHSIQRLYAEEVLARLDKLRDQERFVVEQYGALSCDPDRYPLFAVKTSPWDAAKSTVLVTGGVHGYETSGVQGALRFLESDVHKYTIQFNFVVAPCISPWGYETINRWNPNAIDPNRAFKDEGIIDESSMLIKYLTSIQSTILAHFDLHETTDTDNTTFRPALAARDGTVQTNFHIPDGFYLVGNAENPAAEFQRAIVDGVKQVTHIAPNDSLEGVPADEVGVFYVPARHYGLCMGMTNATFVTTTEVYPDSALVTDDTCTLAQVVAVTSGLEYILQNKTNQ